MSALADLQRALQAHVLQESPDARAREAVISSGAADAEERLGVYAFAYRARLAEVLGNDYPALRAVAGDEDFDALCRAFVEAQPSPHFNVRWYGEALPEFTQRTTPWSQRAWLGEMAELEWQMGLAFDAHGEPAVTVADVAAIMPQRWPGMSLHLQPSLRCLRPVWNVAALRRAYDREEAIPKPALLEAPSTIAIWRRNSTVRYRELEADESAALSAAADGATFTALCETLCEWHAPEAVATRTANFFRVWIEDQWVGALAFDDA